MHVKKQNFQLIINTKTHAHHYHGHFAARPALTSFPLEFSLNWFLSQGVFMKSHLFSFLPLLTVK